MRDFIKNVLMAMLGAVAILLVTIPISFLFDIGFILNADRVPSALDSLRFMLYSWFVVSFAIAMNIGLKVSLKSTLVRCLFIWGPISLGWWLLFETSSVAWFSFGLWVSSFFLAWEAIAKLKQRQVK